MEKVCKLRVVHIVEERRISDDRVDSTVIDVSDAGIAAREVDALSVLERLEVFGDVKAEALG